MTPRRLFLILLLFTALPHTQAQARVHAQSQAQSQSQAQAPARQVGDIPFDPTLDDPNFHLGDSTRVFQYYNSNSWWLDHKDAYRKLFQKAAGKFPRTSAQTQTQSSRLTSRSPQTQSGWLTIRFIVNTKGQTGRYRTLEMDTAYQPFHFAPALTACLLATIKAAHWEPAHYHGKTYDTYQYVTFHFEQGRIVDIMP